MPLHLTPDLLGQIAALNRDINHRITYSSDLSRATSAARIWSPLYPPASRIRGR